jgi:AsmA protein
MELRDGAVRGVNVAQAVREAKARIGAVRGDAPPQTGMASAAEKTDFSELAASFRIANGIAHNEDLAIKSPLLRIGGAGDVNIGEGALDYTVRATVVPTLEGQGGPELQALKGLTVPVQLSGPFASLRWHVDFAGMARGLAQQKLDEKKDELRARAQKEIDEQKAKLGEQLKDQLKGLFGK